MYSSEPSKNHSSAALEALSPQGGPRLRGVACAEGAGLVTYKTKQNSTKQTHQTISFAVPIVAERRIKRLKKSVWASGHLHGLADKGFRPAQAWFVTLTYKGATDWKRDHIKKAMQAFRDWCKVRRIPCRYTWVAELQARGAVHYHLLAWLPQGRRMPKWDRRTVTPTGRKMACWWPHGMTNTQPARSGVGYLMKYMSKLGELTKFPKGIRLYGIGGLDQDGKNVRTWLNLPEWVKCSYGVGEIKRIKRGFCEKSTGLMLEPMFRVHRIPHGIILERLREPPERFHHGAYSTYNA